MNSEHKLEGASNFKAWKTRVDLILTRNKVLGIVTGKVAKLGDDASQIQVENYQEEDIMERSIIVESVRNHLIPYIADHESTKAMYDALIGLYTIKNMNQSISLRNQLRDSKMTNNDIVASYFMKLSQITDQLKAIDEQISKKELVTTSLNEFPTSWSAFISVINGRDTPPSFENFWIPCTQEESSLVNKGMITNEGSQAFASHGKGHKGKKNFGKFQRNKGRGSTPKQNKKKVDLLLKKEDLIFLEMLNYKNLNVFIVMHMVVMKRIFPKRRKEREDIMLQHLELKLHPK